MVARNISTGLTIYEEKIMYKKDLSKLSPKELSNLTKALKRCRDASQSIVDNTAGVIPDGGGRKELKQHLRWYNAQLDKVYAVKNGNGKVK